MMKATEIAAAVPPAVGTFLLTSRQDVPSIIDQQRRCRVNTLVSAPADPTKQTGAIRQAAGNGFNSRARAKMHTVQR